MSRVDGYGRIDRTRTLTFTFDGAQYTGHPGDTLASALLANGVRRIGTSVKLDRPRGITAAWGEDPTGLVQIEEPFPEPMLLATTVDLVDGLVARGLGGRGRLAEVPDTARYDRRHTHCETLVVGAGPAGLLAARTAARRGDRVVLVDDRPAAGGALLGTERICGRDALDFVADTIAELRADPDVRILPRTTAFGHYDDGFVLALERRTDHLAEPPRNVSRQRVWRIRAGHVVVATGAHERPVVVEDNDRPGIMLAASARDLLHRYGVRVGREIVVFTTDDAAHGAAADLEAAGARVTVVDPRPGAGGSATRQAQVVGTRSDAEDGAVTAVTLDDGTVLPCDTLLLSGGWNPTAHLFSHVRGALRYDAELGAFRPGEPLDGVTVVGAANGTFDLAGCLAEGRGETPEPVARTTRVVWRTEGDPARQFVDLQRDSTVADIARAVGAGMRSVEHVKRYTTIGTAHDQGRTSGVIASGITAELLGVPVESLGTTTFRPPYTPVAFAALAGRERGRLYDPERTTALHAWHVEAGAVFEDVGQWKRARYYPRPGEDMEAAVLRECAAARTGVGILDGSTLGKIDVQGPDAGVLLDRIYTNLMSSLKPGRVRYGVMCGVDGMVIDDGTVLRLDEDRFLVYTTTGGAAPILDHLEEWLQTEWPELRVSLTSVTEQWATFPVVGPRSRDVIGAFAPHVDVSNAAFPFMSWLDTEVDGVPVRLARISFSGELAWEVSVDGWHAAAVWQRLLDLGAPYAITPYGTETMHVLRAEKGYPIIGQDTDGTVTPQDLGMDWVVSKKKPDFVGRRSFARPANLDPLRKQLVGLLPVDPDLRLPEGSQIVELTDALPPPPVPMLGHVTSSYRSAALGRTFALALVKGGHARIGERLTVPVGEALVPVEVTGSVVFDPEGTRRDGEPGVH
ncbi:2Fe-2S iron-sulfur cluster-binding protein [Pseudonocardia kujensis]|uniref:2Fe-2S iron-sulfur cluster-binding protein n=1 Tax=Pseudonocardia kujensis TaxID=1128675 RepID=UPI001E5EDDBF|nr:2Fe-2S iron-sulfur cluster-binding protein [Pseudonocardia kujensis]MCE0762729.1 2Fe-2S iron-sulfur cluster-binding protein [Pseudonocardia kujensis]